MLRRLPSWLWLVLALGFGVTATVMATGWLKLQSAKLPPSLETVAVVVATQEIGAATILSPDKLTVRQWPKDSSPPGRFAQLEQAVGRVSRFPLSPGEPVLEHKLTPKGARSGLAALVPPHKRAMTVKVDEASGVAGFIVPGNRVDVVVTINRGQFSSDPFAKLILENILVLGIGQKIESRDGEKPQVFPTVTLEVTPSEGERLALATREGHITLVLRSHDDRAPVSTGGVKTSSFLERAGRGAEPAKAEGGRPNSVEIVRGLDRKSWTL